MVQNPPPGYQRIIPYLLYEDALAALEFLGKAFGLKDRFHFDHPMEKSATPKWN